MLGSLVLSVAGMIIGPVLAQKLPLPVESRNSLALGASFLILLAGAFYTIIDLINSLKDEFSKTRKDSADLISSAVNSGTLVSYDGVQALTELSERLQFSKLALNTRLTPEHFGEIYSATTSNWNSAIAKNIKRGLIFREVVSNSGIGPAKELAELVKSASRNKGNYFGSEIGLDHQTSLNFIVLHLNDNTKEVWFGWLLTKGRQLEKRCFRSSNKELIDVFEDWHGALMAGGTSIV
jgi:hypothetical protein